MTKDIFPGASEPRSENPTPAPAPVRYVAVLTGPEVEDIVSALRDHDVVGAGTVDEMAETSDRLEALADRLDNLAPDAGEYVTSNSDLRALAVDQRLQIADQADRIRELETALALTAPRLAVKDKMIARLQSALRALYFEPNDPETRHDAREAFESAPPRASEPADVGPGTPEHSKRLEAAIRYLGTAMREGEAAAAYFR